MALDEIQDAPGGGARLELRVSLPNGLHARPAAQLAREAQRFSSTVRLVAGGAEADARSMLDLLSLCLSEGALCALEARGPDAREAVAALAGLLRRGA